jgi:hypothetical protein
MSKLGPICAAEIIQSKLFDYQSFMSDPRHCKRKIVSDLGSTEGYYIGLDAKGKCSPFVYTVARTQHSDTPSVVVVRTDKGAA